MLKVVITNAEGETREEVFDKQVVMLGRAESNDVRLSPSKGVSRYHARVDVNGQKISIQDLKSTNGTYVNSELIQTMVVVSSDKIQIGDFVLQFSYVGEEKKVEESRKEEKESNAALEQVILKSCAKDKPDFSTEPEAEKSQLTSSSDEKKDFYWSSLKNFLKPIWSCLNDDSVSEIMINGESEIYIERKGELHQIDACFTEAELKAAVLNIAQYVDRRVSEEEPYLDARLPDGSRVAVLMPPCSRKGIAIAISKFGKESLTVDKLLNLASFSQDMLAFLKACVLLRKNIVVSGGTSSGKTSLLNVLSSLIPSNERIITIEDSSELQLQQTHVVPMETKPADKKGRGAVSIRDLVKTSLRMRPDRIIVGEIRGGEALDLLQAMNTGHSGSMTTIHASSPAQALSRLETLSLFSGLDIPVRALREQVSSAVEIVVQAARLSDHSRRVTHISEVLRLGNNDQYQVKDIFIFKKAGTENGKILGQHIWTGETPSWKTELELAGLDEVVSFRTGTN